MSEIALVYRIPRCGGWQRTGTSEREERFHHNSCVRADATKMTQSFNEESRVAGQGNTGCDTKWKEWGKLLYDTAEK
jgi:hypothetical protein